MNFEILFSEDCFKSEEIERVDTTPDVGQFELFK